MDDLLEIAGEEPIAVAAITASEILFALYRAGDARRRRARELIVERVLAALPIVPFDLDAARAHSRLWSQMAAAGTMIGAHDLLIAATALAGSYRLLTLNTREFGRVPGLMMAPVPWN